MSKTKKELTEENKELKRELELKGKSGYCVSWKSDKIPDTIRVTDCNGKSEIYNIRQMVMERVLEEFDKIICQAELIYLTGKFQSYEHAFKHLKNRMDYQEKSIQDSLKVKGTKE
jgi:hypothetical protein